MSPALPWTGRLALAAVALAAGTVDAIAGGGGLLTVPALLFAGLPPHLALGTNKGQSTFGSGAALVRYARAKMVNARHAGWAFGFGAVGALGGAALQLCLRPDLLKPIVLVLLVAVAVGVAIRPPAPKLARFSAGTLLRLASAIALTLGAYDGFFGPGTGSFLILAFVMLLGMPMAAASAEAKVVNFASNLAALSVFAARGTIVWAVALPMAAGQLCGGWLGAHLTVRRGSGLVRWVMLAVVSALAVKLGTDFFSASRP